MTMTMTMMMTKTMAMAVTMTRNVPITVTMNMTMTMIMNLTMYLLTEREGLTGKYLARCHDVRTERSVENFENFVPTYIGRDGPYAGQPQERFYNKTFPLFFPVRTRNSQFIEKRDLFLFSFKFKSTIRIHVLGKSTKNKHELLKCGSKKSLT